MNAILNAAPRPILNGIHDLSQRAAVMEAEVRPTHFPLFFFYAQKGVEEPQFITSDTLTELYGTQTINPRSKYYTHQTEFLSSVLGEGNACMGRRLVPADARTARLLIALEIVADPAVAQYQRAADGSYLLDAAGKRILKSESTVAGYTARWVVNPYDRATTPYEFGQAPTRAGEAIGSTATEAQIYPILELEASSAGAWGSNAGLVISAPTTESSSPLNDTLASKIHAYLYRFAVVNRADAMSSPVVTETLNGSQSLDLCFKDGAVNAALGTEVSVQQALINAYRDVSTPGFTPSFGTFKQLKVYTQNLETILTMIQTSESGYDTIPGTPNPETIYEVNPFTGTDFNGVPYYSLNLLDESDDGTSFTSSTVLYAEGGADGTMSLEAFDALVRSELTNFGVAGIPYKNWAKYPFSVLYDSGFTLDTKLAFGIPMSRRKDIWVQVCTQDVLQPQNTGEEETAVATALQSAFRNYPESEVYGTSVCRALVVGQSGRLISGSYRGPQDNLLPLGLEVARKLARYMGAGNGIWKRGLGINVPDNNRVTTFRDINATYKTDNARTIDWNTGLIYALDYDRSSVFWPAFQTVYDDDSSVLNSMVTMIACVEAEKVCLNAWRNLTGIDYLTQAQFIERSNEMILKDLDGRFDNRFVFQVETYFTENDTTRGYSWSTVIRIYAPNMMTVGSFTVESHRMSDLDA